MDFNPLDHVTPPADLEALKKIANDIYKRHFRRDAIALEVGSWVGSSALAVVPFMDEVYCVDHFRGNYADRLGDVAAQYGSDAVFQTFCKNVGDRLFRTVFPCVGESLVWASVWTRKIDLLFIDGSHEYEDVRSDLIAWIPHVAPRGVVAVHDYGVFDGVTRAVQEILPYFQRAGATLAYTEIP